MKPIIKIFSIFIIIFLFLITYSQALEKTYEGFDVVGRIEIPSIELDYPVLKEATAKSLEKSVAVTYPSGIETLNLTKNIEISGHNLEDGMLFSNLSKLKKGDTIYITGMDDKKIEYEIYKIEEKSTTEGAYATRDTNGKREITLVTSLEGGSKRLRIYAAEKESNTQDTTSVNMTERNSDKDLPKTGESDILELLIAFFIVLGGVFYINYEKTEK